MRRLVLATMVACIATLATGCIISSDDDPPIDDVGFIRADWDFTTAAGADLGCPVGFGTVEVTANPTTAGGTPFVDKYDCIDGTGTADYDLDEYDVVIEVTDDAGVNVYAASLTQTVDLVPGDAVVSEDFVDDGGRMIFDWVLVDNTNAVITCAEAGGDKVSIINTVSGGSASVEDTFPCNDGTGITDPIADGTYTAALDVLNAAGQAIGTQSTTKTNVTIQGPNDYNDLGTVMIDAEP